MARLNGVRSIKIGLSLADASRVEQISAAIAKRGGFQRVAVRECDILLSDGEDLTASGFHALTVLWSDAEVVDLATQIRAVLPGSLDADDVLSAVRLVAAGLAINSAEEQEGFAAEDETESADIVQLTSRELQVLQLVAAGNSNKEIAKRLSLSVHTVKFHVSSIFIKLRATSRIEAVGIGLRNGMVMI